MENKIKVITLYKVMQTKKLRSEGRTIYYFNNDDRKVFHNWEGPAIIHDNKTKDEYYIFGQKMTLEEWKEAKRDFNGVPPSKNPSYEQSMLH